VESKCWQALLEEHKELLATTPIIMKQYAAYQHNDIPGASDLRITTVPVQECNEAVIDLKSPTFLQNSPRLYMMPDPTYPVEGPEYNSGLPGNSRIRATVAIKLLDMVDKLDAIAPYFGYEIGQIHVCVCDAFRNKQVQEFSFNSRQQYIAKKHPDWSPEEVYNETAKFIAPSKPPFIHPSGAAADIRLWDARNKVYLDLGEFGVPWMKDPSTVATFAENITEQQKINRLFCIVAAELAGLVNYPGEFWHFSFGDCMATYWSGSTLGEYRAIYGLVEAEELEISIEDGRFKITVLEER